MSGRTPGFIYEGTTSMWFFHIRFLLYCFRRLKDREISKVLLIRINEREVLLGHYVRVNNQIFVSSSEKFQFNERVLTCR